MALVFRSFGSPLSDSSSQREDRYCEMLTFRLISSVTYVKRSNIHTKLSRLLQWKNQNPPTTSNKRLQLHNQYHNNWTECINILCKHKIRLHNLISIASLNAKSLGLGLRNKTSNDEIGSTMWPVAQRCFAMDKLGFSPARLSLGKFSIKCFNHFEICSDIRWDSRGSVLPM